MSNRTPAARAYAAHCEICVDCAAVDSATSSRQEKRRCETGKVLVKAAAEENAQPRREKPGTDYCFCTRNPHRYAASVVCRYYRYKGTVQ